MNFKKLESGRSMVEMLGVLAIIGVLSVGGIAGYSLSMRRHRANQIADYTSKYAMLLYGKCQGQILNNEVTDITECGVRYHPDQFDLGNLPAGMTNIAGYKILSDTTTGVDTIVVSASFDDDKLCQAVGAIAGTGCDQNAGRVVFFNIKQN